MRGQLDEHASGDTAGAVNQDRVPGGRLQRVAHHLVRGQRRNRQGGAHSKLTSAGSLAQSCAGTMKRSAQLPCSRNGAECAVT